MNIHLRALEPEDLTLLYTIENAPEMWDVGTAATPYSHFALRQYIEQMGDDITQTGDLRFVIETKDDNTQCAAVGLIDLTSYDARSLRAEVSIAILTSHRGRGIATEALRLLEEHCRNYLHLHQMYALIPTNNEASLALFQKCGFTKVSILPEWHYNRGEYQDVAIFQKIL